VTGVQLGMFVAPLVVARAGFIGGEVAGLMAIAGWFLVGLPMSYSLAERAQLREARRRERGRAATVALSPERVIVPSP